MATVLVVEDDALLQKIYRKELEEAGIHVHVASSGEQALDMLAKPEAQPDVIILDIVLPGKDGYDVLEELRKLPSFTSIPVIILTNLKQKVEVERAQNLGAKEFLSKSDIKEGDLVKVVRWHVEHKTT